MPLTFVTGDLLETPADIRINTVNCVGVMGAGLALAFKTKYPSMFKAYQKECKAGNIQPGRLHVWQDRSNGEQIINFPTKRHWRQPSRYEDVEAGLAELRKYLAPRGETRVVLPALGAGHGGLDWSRVKQMIVDHLADLDANIFVFSPFDSRQSASSIEQEQLRIAGITVVPPDNSNYPTTLRGRTTATLYAKGDIARLDQQLLAILSSSKPDSREIAATEICIEQLTQPGVTILTGYGPSTERPAIRAALEKQLEVVIYIADGINHFRVRKDLQDIWDDTRITVISFAEPTKRWNAHLDSRAKSIALFLAKAVLITDPSPKWLPSIPNTQEQVVLPKVFYLSYQSQDSDMQKMFDRVNAAKIGRNSRDGMPNLASVISIFDEASNVKPATATSIEKASSDSSEVVTASKPKPTNGRARRKKAVVAEQMAFEGIDVPANDTSKPRKKPKRAKTAAT